MPDYLIKDIHEETMREFKTAAAYFKQTMRQVLMDAIDIKIGNYRKGVRQFQYKPPYTKKKEK